MVFRFLTSLKLTLSLLLGLAFVSIFGTLAKVEDNRFEVFYQTPWFRILLLLLAFNIAACTWKTIRRNLEDRKEFRNRIREEFESREIFESSPVAIEQDLKARRFRIDPVDGGLLASRGRIGRWGSTLVHVSLLVIMAGGIMSELGFVGTQIVPEGESTTSYFDWDFEADRPLGFEFRVDDFELEHYPIELKIGTYKPETRELVREYVTREGESIDLPLEGMTARVVAFDPYEKALTLEIFHRNNRLGTYVGLPADSKRKIDNPLDRFLVIKPTAFRDPVLKQTLTDVSILEGGEVVRQARIMINHPLVYKGVAFYQTAYNRDEFGFWYVGFQISKDPGEPLVWTGSILLVIGLYVAFFMRYRVLAVVPGNRTYKTIPLAGFNDTVGRKIIEEIHADHDQRA